MLDQEYCLYIPDQICAFVSATGAVLRSNLSLNGQICLVVGPPRFPGDTATFLSPSNDSSALDGGWIAVEKSS